MSAVDPGETPEVLRYLHGKLDQQFSALRDQRAKLNPVAPVFALEHDLGEAELELLKGGVRTGIRHYHVGHFEATWLPFIVYAAEIGYGYVGDEYWATFSSETPRWTDQERSTIRDWFRHFHDRYGGARPVGAWASHFTIICWPITHAVLPVYLQRQLAELLYDFRTGLTSALLHNPDELGVRLAARAGLYSDRFRNFCQNTRLVGQVAVALLSGDEQVSPYLVKSTLDRLVDGLSHERDARHWLASAQQAANRVRASGFSRRSSSGTRASSSADRLPRATDPRLFLRRLDRTWHAYAEFPDMTSLSERLPAVYDELRTHRARVNGHQRAVPTRALIYPGQQISFDSWPDPTKPLVQLERGSETVNRLLSDQVGMSHGPWWLFRRQDAGTAVETKGRFLRPGHHYVLIGVGNLEPPPVSWCTPTSLAVVGASAWQLDVPDPLSDADAALLVSHSLPSLATVAIRPVGLVASSWDGEGDVEWLVGEPSLLGIRAEVQPARSLITVGGDPHFVTWPADQRELILLIDDLDVGSHAVTATLIAADNKELTRGEFMITIRDPQVRPESAAIGEGIRVLASPARPTLAELWGDRAILTFDGPPKTNAELVVALRGEDSRKLGELHRTVTLPVDEGAWTALTRDLREQGTFKKSYEEAESCTITVQRDGVGMASLTCERGFQPLRWRFCMEHDGSYTARLHDQTDRGNTSVQLYSVEHPLVAVELEPGTDIPLPPRGGLLQAIADGLEVTSLAPTQPNQVWSLGRVVPQVPYSDPSDAEITGFGNAYWLWTSAELPADPLAVYQQERVVEAISRATVMLLCGPVWARIERRIADTNAGVVLGNLFAMKNAIGDREEDKTLARQIDKGLDAWSTPTEVLEGFAAVVAPHLHQSGIEVPSAAHFLLTMAGLTISERRFGWIAQEWSKTDCTSILVRVKMAPEVLRAARYAALGSWAVAEPGDAERGF